MRIIDGDKLMETIRNNDYPLKSHFNSTDNGMFTIGIQQAVDMQPTVDAAPVKHGRWIKGGYVCGENEYKCSVCGETEWRTSSARMKYCMFCGANMDGGDADDH